MPQQAAGRHRASPRGRAQLCQQLPPRGFPKLLLGSNSSNYGTQPQEQMPILESQQLQELFALWGQQQPAVCPPQGSLLAAPLRRGLSINTALPVLTAGCPLEAFLCGCTRLLQECTVPPRTRPLPCASTKVSGCEGGRRAAQCSRGWLQSPASPRPAEGTCSREQSHRVCCEGTPTGRESQALQLQFTVACLHTSLAFPSRHC